MQTKKRANRALSYVSARIYMKVDGAMAGLVGFVRSRSTSRTTICDVQWQAVSGTVARH